jgi:Cytochrome P450
MARSAFCPFSIGPRGCIGKALAYRIMRLTLARIIFTYEMRVAKGTSLGKVSAAALQCGITEGDFATKDVFTSHNKGPIVEFKQRVS